MSKESYGPPVDKLLALGDPREMEEPNLSEEWPDYNQFGIGPEHIGDLIRILTDKELNQADSESKEVWGPLHAWRALGGLRAEAAIGPLIGLFHERKEDDWVGEEVPVVLGMIGQAAIPALKSALAHKEEDAYPRVYFASALEAIGKEHPEYRAECVAVLTRQLELFADQDPVLNAFLIDSLINLKATEAAPIIERAFAADSVDTMVVGDWEEVQVDLGLKEPGEEQLQREAEAREIIRWLTSPSPASSSETPEQPDRWFAVTPRDPDRVIDQEARREKTKKSHKKKKRFR